MTRKLILLAAALAMVAVACGSAESPHAGGTNEAIRVHGDWTIEIREPDGTLASRHEFHNDLNAEPGDPAFSGEIALASLLAGIETIGTWFVYVDDSADVAGPCDSSGQTRCMIAEPTSPFPDQAALFKNLTVEAPSDTLTLSGSAIADLTGVISHVSTWFMTCAPSVAPNDCIGETAEQVLFTFADVGPFNVEPGQQVLVTVDLTFS